MTDRTCMTVDDYTVRVCLVRTCQALNLIIYLGMTVFFKRQLYTNHLLIVTFFVSCSSNYGKQTFLFIRIHPPCRSKNSKVGICRALLHRPPSPPNRCSLDREIARRSTISIEVHNYYRSKTVL